MQTVGGHVQLGGDVDGEAAGDNFGYSVALSSGGTIMAAGASRNDGGGSYAGHVRVFEYSGGSWVQMGGDVDGEAAGDNFGISVALSSGGTIMAAGAWYNDGGGTNAGHVRVFEYSGGSWVQMGGDVDGEAVGDNFGYSVALSSGGTIMAAGAYYNDGGGSDAGHVRVFISPGNRLRITLLHMAAHRRSSIVAELLCLDPWPLCTVSG
jgi:hypothetical protein